MSPHALASSVTTLTRDERSLKWNDFASGLQALMCEPSEHGDIPQKNSHTPVLWKESASSPLACERLVDPVPRTPDQPASQSIFVRKWVDEAHIASRGRIIPALLRDG